MTSEMGVGGKGGCEEGVEKNRNREEKWIKVRLWLLPISSLFGNLGVPKATDTRLLLCFCKITMMLKRILKNGSSSQKDCWNCKTDLASWDRLDSERASQRFLRELSTHKIPTFFPHQSPKAAVHKSLCWPPASPGVQQRPLILLQETIWPWSLSAFTGHVRQVSVHWLSNDCDPVSLALGIPGQPRNLLMTSSSLMTAVAFNSSLLLSPKLSVSLGWLPPTSFVFEEKVWPFSHW